MPPEKIESDLEMTDKYTIDADKLAPHVHMRHPNRNIEKGVDHTKQKQERNSQAKKAKNETFTQEFSGTVPEELPGIMYKQLFEQLAGFHSAVCISVYIPTHNAGVEVNEQQDSIAYKNAVQQVRKQLQQRGTAETVIEKILEPAFELLRDEVFWHNQSNGLAVFMAEGYFRYLKMPVTPQEEIYMNTSFFLTPLVPAMESAQHFFLLMISKRQAVFYRVDRFGIERMDIEELPHGIDDVVHFEEKEGGGLFRTGGHGGTGSANFHGIGAGQPDEKTNIALYLKEVDRTLWQKVLGRENVPLLLAGADHIVPIYKQVSSYKYIADESLTGNYEHHTAVDLYKEAMDKMGYYFRSGTEEALESYYNNSATALTSTVLAKVISASYYSQVSDLFVQRGAHLWGSFNEQDNVLTIHETKQPGDDCLVDKAVIKTILNGGQVHLLDADKMPDKSMMAALFRY